MTASKAETPDKDSEIAAAMERLSSLGRNDICTCGVAKKYKKCCQAADEALTRVVQEAPDATALARQGWQLIEQKRPAAAQKRFAAALELDADSADAKVGHAMAQLSAGDKDDAIAALQTELFRRRAETSDTFRPNTKELPPIRTRQNHHCCDRQWSGYAHWD